MSEPMQFDMREADGWSVLTMSGELTIYAASAASAAMSAALDATRDLQIDLSGVSEFDVSALQLLRACGREATQRGLAFEVVGHPPALKQTIDLLGLAPTLSDLEEDGTWT